MSVPRIYTAVYSGIPVFEMVVKDIAIMRRRLDSHMNATQILKVAGVDKGKRTKILEREINPDEGEKVQGGYGKFQGTWIPLQTSIELARRYQVYELIQPMLEFDPATAGSIEEKRHLPTNKDQGPSQSTLKKREHPSFSIMSSTTASTSDIHPPKKSRMKPTSIEPSSNDYSAEAKHRTILMSIFLSDDTTNVSELLKTSEQIDLNVPLDEQGNTALHWAASLARINTVEQLITHGANIDRQNNMGETPLMRCVAATNSFDCDCFRKLLRFLEGSLYVTDHQRRTILHHIALTAAVEGRINAALYYMHHVLYSLEKSAPSSSPQVKTRFLNRQDDQGDTAISIATRLDSTRMIQLLVDAGADQSSENNIGLTPNDYANTANAQQPSHPQVTADKPKPLKSPPPATYTKPPTGPTQRNKEIMTTMQKIVDSLDEEYGNQLSTREAQLSQTKVRLMETTRILEDARKQLEKRQEESQVYAEGQQKVRDLKEALEAAWVNLEALMRNDNKELNKAAVLALDMDKTIDPSLVDTPLKARVTAYEHNNADLERHVAGLRAETVEKEMQCKRLIAACCGLTLDKVDELVEPLTLAIESDPPDLDLARVMGFMEKIRRQGSFPDPTSDPQ